MKYPLRILLAGRSQSGLESIEKILEQYGGVNISTRFLNNGHVDPLSDLDILPEILIYVVGDLWADELAALSSRPLHERPHTLVVGPDGDISRFRAAMRAGARDYFTLPLSGDDFSIALDQITEELQLQKSRTVANLTVVINTKGGSGASVVSTNIAYIDAVDQQRRTLLVDLDFQFGAIPVYLNLSPNNGLLKALHEVETLDAVAIEGMVLKHSGGLRILSSSQDDLILPEEIPQSRIAALFRLLGDTYDEIVVDMPRQIDAITSLILQHADKVVIVMEASLAHVRDAKRLLHILQKILGLPENRIKLVVNRYDKNGSLQKSDIKTALAFNDIVTLPSDFRRVNESINLGSPLYEMARSAPITKSLVGLSHSLRDIKAEKASSKYRSRLFTWVRSSRTET